jgi:non-specific serine/threonine protein kinase
VRQQTLRQAIDWSHEPAERRREASVPRLAVFAGSCTLEAARPVCNPRQDPGLSVLDGMSSLVDKSLIQEVDAAPDELRFTMLETVREYALEQLDASGEHPVTRRRPCRLLPRARRGRARGRSPRASATSGWRAASASTTTTAPPSIT